MMLAIVAAGLAVVAAWAVVVAQVCDARLEARR